MSLDTMRWKMRVSRSSRRTLAALAAASLAAGLLASCSSKKDDEATPGNTDSPSNSGGDTFVFGASSDPKVLDGAYVSDGESLRVIEQIYETLVTTAPGSTDVQPLLAKSWESSTDGKSWTFHLQSGVKFHDGTDFNAEAVCFNFDRWYNFKGAQQNPDSSYYWQAVYGGFKTQEDNDAPKESIYSSCEAKDAETAVINLTEPFPAFLPTLVLPAFSLGSPKAIQDYGDEVEVAGDSIKFIGKYGLEHPTGTGPFKFKSWTPGDKLTLERNDDYWGTKAQIKTLIYKSIPDGNARRQALEAGEIDGYDLVSPQDVKGLEDGGFQVLSRPAFNVGYVGFNQDKAPLNNLKVREAIAYALNRDAVVKANYPESAEVANQFMPPSMWGYNKSGLAYEYNPEKAKQLLAESGVKDLSVEFWLPTDVSRPYMPDPKPIYDAFKSDLEAVGFKVTTKTGAWATDYLGGVHNGAAGIYLLGWTGDWGDPDNFVGTFFGKPSPDWGMKWDAQGQKIQADLTKARQTFDLADREVLYQDINKQLFEFVPGVPYVHTQPYLAFKKTVKGYVPSPVSLEPMWPVSITKG
jgi:peptide/nickel transport system substrate-binding protein